MRAATKITIIGIGYKPFDKKAWEIVLNSDVILASRRLYEVYQRYDGFDAVKGKVMVHDNISETIKFIHDNCETKKIVLLASGDPLFSGIGRKAVEEFGKDAVEIIPDMSSVQVAFSRLKEPWDDAFLISLHGGPDPAKRRRLPYEINDIPSLVEKHNKLAVLTDKENNPTAIARTIMDSATVRSPRVSGPIMYVCERLGYEDERITGGLPEDIAKQVFSDPNVVIILGQLSEVADPKPPVTSFGLRESEMTHSAGLITKDEVRAVTIHKLRLPQKGVLWDIGSGSGSVSIEAARLFPGLKVYAIEKDRARIADITENRERFKTYNIEIIEGPAPDVLNTLPNPDRVFIGGGSSRLEEILACISSAMPSGITVINATQLETLSKAIDGLQKAGFVSDVSQVSVSRGKAVGKGNYLSALNPVFIISGIKDGEGGQI
ncbi:MAG: precorrin-6y C5,15-methyltransferase (decarboxylating) subunit CbiE [Nitrospirae bacterium]|nr:precorrin-6y C5,15-methyltransferase (decarboxylating) subunit CbiE [Nitrospirota bacterium]